MQEIPCAVDPSFLKRLTANAQVATQRMGVRARLAKPAQAAQIVAAAKDNRQRRYYSCQEKPPGLQASSEHPTKSGETETRNPAIIDPPAHSSSGRSTIGPASADQSKGHKIEITRQGRVNACQKIQGNSQFLAVTTPVAVTATSGMITVAAIAGQAAAVSPRSRDQNQNEQACQKAS